MSSLFFLKMLRNVLTSSTNVSVGAGSAKSLLRDLNGVSIGCYDYDSNSMRLKRT